MPQMQMEINDKDLHEFERLISNKISTSHPLIKENKKKKLLSNDIMALCALLLNANDQLITHKSSLSEFGNSLLDQYKHYIKTYYLL